ncbi:hypothetical protein F5890DRAFT_1415958, partial [Lentinula detonsa]
KWFKDAFDFLNIDLGTSFATLVACWLKFEGLYGWKPTRNVLSSVRRPKEVSKWIRYGRYAKINITIAPSQIEGFAERMWLWWLHLQPKWRELGQDLRPLPVEQFGDDWRLLDVHGINGWLSLLAGLRWWGESLAKLDSSERNSRSNDWLALIADMCKMLEGLTMYKQKTM